VVEFGECDPVEVTTFEGPGGFDTPDEALKAGLVDFLLPAGASAATADPIDPPEGADFAWHLPSDSGVPVGVISAMQSDDGWRLNVGEWCSPSP
jgi:hypothetical protein